MNIKFSNIFNPFRKFIDIFFKWDRVVAFLSLIIFLIFSSFLLISEFKFVYPSHFPKPIYNFKNNPLNSIKIELGQILFYDPILSKDKSISCASCHSPFNAFSHTDHDLSHGIEDQIGNRNAPALFNLAWHKNFMWDGSINHLDVQALAPITHPKEMGENILSVVQKLNKSENYKKMFYKAFNDSNITGEKLLKVLSQFQLSLVSSGSKYDKVQMNKDTFNFQEKKGYQIFKKHCNSCHTEPLFSNFQFEKNGLPIDTTLNDFGRFAISKQAKDSFLFKTPSLRNLSYTYPYMHDGRFSNLNQVLNHYSKNFLVTSKLSSNERVDLTAFLLTLDDKEFVFNKKHHYKKSMSK